MRGLLILGDWHEVIGSGWRMGRRARPLDLALSLQVMQQEEEYLTAGRIRSAIWPLVLFCDVLGFGRTCNVSYRVGCGFIVYTA